MHTLYTRVAGLALITFIVMTPVTAFAATASFAEEDIVTTTTKPTLTGEADMDKLRLVVRNEDNKIVYKRDVRVKEGAWKAKISRSLKKGTYTVSLYEGKKTQGEALATTDLTLESKQRRTSGAGKGTTLSVSSVPLLFGGTARANTSVPVAYIQVVNTSKKESTLNGFTLMQRGSAPTSVITGFLTNDDKGGSRTTVAASFKGGRAYVPLAATLAPGQLRIFTIKAMVGAQVPFGQQLMLDVTGIDSAASIKATFPLRGTTWTLAY